MSKENKTIKEPKKIENMTRKEKDKLQNKVLKVIITKLIRKGI